jgi:hypothetical protein
MYCGGFLIGLFFDPEDQWQLLRILSDGMLGVGVVELLVLVILLISKCVGSLLCVNSKFVM